MKTILTIFGLFFLGLTITAQTVDLQKGLVAFYPFNGNANDESGNGNNGKASSGVSLSTDRNGNPNSCYNFNGSTSNIDLSRPPANFTNSNNYSLFAWIKTADAGKGYRGVIVKQNAIGLFLKDNKVMAFDWKIRVDKTSSGNVSDNIWHFIGLTLNNGIIKFYIDGQFTSSSTYSIQKQTQSFVIGAGRNPNGRGQNFEGYIDDVRIYSRAINESEIQALYTESDKNPKLEISNLKLENSKGNNTIGTYQAANLKFNISNIGKGDAKNVEVRISETNYASGLDYPTSKFIGDIIIGNNQDVSIPIKATKGLKDGTANFSIQLIEKNGVNSTKKTLLVKIKPIKSLTEEIKMYVESKVNDWQQKGEFEKSSEYKNRVNETTRAQKIEEYQVEAIKKYKKQFAQSINYNDIKLNTYDADNECFLLSSSQLGEFVVPVPLSDAPTFKNNFSSLKFQNSEFIINDDNFVLSYIEIVGANNKKYIYDSKNKTTYALTKIDYKFSDIEVDVEDKTVANNSNIQKTANTISVGKADVDIDIPNNPQTKIHTYALIIGNEDYSSFQTGLNTEINVDYAMNDAIIFKEYCIKTLGISEKQVKLLTNATFGQMSQGIAWINNLAKIENGNAELIFYYSGHGLPDEQTKESYIMPVDISGTNITQAIKLTDVYNKLNAFPSKKVSVFLDACFSGGGRNQGLIAMKGVKIVPKANMVTGNMIVFSSSTGQESSGVYREKHHGYMTYFLLKKLQESKGDITYKDLADYVIDHVKKEAALNGKNQTPQLNFSPGVEGIWSNWKMK